MTTVPALGRLRAHARHATLFAPTTLADAVVRLGFVQADPIRAPARAQDLILRHRVRGYRDYLPRRFPLPHPSWRTAHWERQHPWFTEQVLPALRRAVAGALDDAG